MEYVEKHIREKEQKVTRELLKLKDLEGEKYKKQWDKYLNSIEELERVKSAKINGIHRTPFKVVEPRFNEDTDIYKGIWRFASFNTSLLGKEESERLAKVVIKELEENGWEDI